MAHRQSCIADAAGIRGRIGETVMRARPIIAIAAALLAVVGLKLTFLAAPTAEADTVSIKSASLDVSRMHEGKNLPVQKDHDMSVVFSDAD
jgi:hypothetical protein